MPATPPPPAGIRTRGGCSYGGFGLLRYVSCRSTALGANRVAGNSAAGWHSHPGRVLLRGVRASPIGLRRGTALGAKRVCRQLRRRRLAFAPGAGAPTGGAGFSEMFRVGAPPRCETGLPATPPPAGIRTRGGCSYGGLGLLRYVSCRSTALGANRVAGNSAAGWHSHPGRVLLRGVRASPICFV